MEKVKICICNCKIKNYSLFINIKNKNAIYCGDSCKNRLKLKESNINIINRLFYKKYNKQEYELIKDDLFF